MRSLSRPTISWCQRDSCSLEACVGMATKTQNPSNLFSRENDIQMRQSDPTSRTGSNENGPCCFHITAQLKYDGPPRQWMFHPGHPSKAKPVLNLAAGKPKMCKPNLSIAAVGPLGRTLRIPEDIYPGSCFTITRDPQVEKYYLLSLAQPQTYLKL